MKKQSKIQQGMRYLLFFIAALVVVEIIALVILQSQVKRYKTYWENQAATSVSSDALVYVALGDSAAQGIGATSPRRGYVGLLAKSLENKSGQQVHVINISKTGARLEDCIEQQLPKLAELSPDIVTIEIGANNMRDFDEVSFEKNMSTIMAALPRHTIISDMPYFGGGRFKAYENNVLKANEIIDRLAAKYDLRVAQLHEEIKSNNHINTYAADFFHPSNAGYKNWHNAFWKILQQD